MKPSDVKALELLTYSQKIQHWAGEDPWSPDEGRYRFENPDLGTFRIRFLGGHIAEMPLLVGRPCFGILTARLRYKNAMKAVSKRGMVPVGRCSRCKISDQCEKVVRRRIAANPDIRSAFEAWLLAEGPNMFGHPHWKELAAGKAWFYLVRTARQNPFTSCNDEAVAEHYRDRSEKAREADRVRKVEERKRALKDGVVDDRHLEDLWTAANQRIKRVVAAVRDARESGGSRKLTQLTPDSLRELRDVWVGRQLMILRRRRANAAAIARWIVENGHRNTSKNQDALATRVRRDVDRIETFERMSFAGGTVLPRFDPDSELRE